MVVGVPKEIVDHEYRVAVVPAGVEELAQLGHRVLVQRSAGVGSSILDREFEQAGAKLVSAQEVYRRAELVVKVKEPQPSELKWLRPGQIVFCFLHFAAHAKLLKAALKRRMTCFAYETIEDDHGHLPLLYPMSEVAGRMAVQEGAKCLERPMLGRGILLSGVPGVPPAHVVILGGGTVGMNAAKVAAGLGARVTILDTNLERLRYLDDIMPQHVTTLMSNTHNIRKVLSEADLLIGAVLRRGARTPVLVTHTMLGLMRPGSAIVDVAIDQGGCVETSRPTTHSHPTYVVHGIVHYCVTNMPGAVAGTSTFALTNATLPYVVAIAQRGFPGVLRANRILARGLNTWQGRVTLKAIADQYKLEYHAPERIG